MRRSYRLVPKLCLGTPLQAKLSLASIFVPKYNLGTSREKELLASALQKAPGIGPVRRRQLLTHFTNLEAVKTATVEEIAALQGFNHKVAENLKDWLAGGGQGM